MQRRVVSFVACGVFALCGLSGCGSGSDQGSGQPKGGKAPLSGTTETSPEGGSTSLGKGDELSVNPQGKTVQPGGSLKAK